MWKVIDRDIWIEMLSTSEMSYRRGDLLFEESGKQKVNEFSVTFLPRKGTVLYLLTSHSLQNYSKIQL